MESESPDDSEHEGPEHEGPEHESAEHEDAEHEDGLVSRLTLIEEQPLDTRADAYGHLHEQLRARLEGGDQPERHG